jgi:hypothetical protein
VDKTEAGEIAYECADIVGGVQSLQKGESANFTAAEQALNILLARRQILLASTTMSLERLLLADNTL